MKIGAIGAFWFLSVLLTACSVSPAVRWWTPGSPSFKLTREEQMAALEAATPCCFKFADLPYTKIESMPFDDYFNIDQSSPVLAESGSKSFALGLELPANPAATRLDFISVQTTSWITILGFFLLRLLSWMRPLASWYGGTIFFSTQKTKNTICLLLLE